MKAQPTGTSAKTSVWRVSPARKRRRSARRRSHVQRSLRSARRGIPPPAAAPTMSARRMVLRNIVRGQGRSWLLRRRGHVSWEGMEHRRQLVGAVGRPVEDGAIEANEDRHDLGVELDAAELLELVDGLLVGQRGLAIGA